MKFLIPSGGTADSRFAGILTSPAHRGPPAPEGIRAGMMWAAENEAYTRGFDPDRFFPWLEEMAQYKERCLFIPVPDVVGDCIQTLENYRHWRRWFGDWPVAFIAQDGQEHMSFPRPHETWGTLFIGGTTAWKESAGAIDCIRRGQELGKRIHIGRVNWKRRYDMFKILAGSEGFTCDGTRVRFDGREKALEAWSGYMDQQTLIQI